MADRESCWRILKSCGFLLKAWDKSCEGSMAAWPQLRTNSAATDLHSRPAGIQSSACLDEWGSCIDLMKALRKLPNGIDADAFALCTMALYTVQAPLHLSRLWHPFKPCRCCLTAAPPVLFETLLQQCCRIIVVFGLPASVPASTSISAFC